MRIALVAPLVTVIAQPFVGGAQAMLADLARGLQRRGHNVTLFAREGSAIPGLAIEQLAVPEIVRPSTFSTPGTERPTDPGFFAQANIFLDLFLHLRQRQHEFDLIHAHAFDWPAFVHSALIQDIPIVHTIHLPAVSPEINAALQILHRQQHPLTLITVSHACAQTYADFTPFDAIIYNGLDLQTIPFAEQIPVDAPLLFAGRITPEKGVEEAIEIAQRAGVRLLIAGGIYDQPYYEEHVLPHLQQEHVTYLGHLDHDTLWKLMSQARGLVFPIAWDEPFGLAPVEAMATGTPVIAFRRGAAAEVIRDGETGFLIEPGDCEQAALRVNDLASISRARCREHVEQHFSLERMLDAYEDMYQTLSMERTRTSAT
ncbi:MAG TPA: glycosyltransferase family 4 protein [Ktedonobacteraceae bacterium]|nr:glycosyltransferase family 4 protein [Ktedonobacteraceae bacterium]